MSYSKVDPEAQPLIIADESAPRKMTRRALVGLAFALAGCVAVGAVAQTILDPVTSFSFFAKCCCVPDGDNNSVNGYDTWYCENGKWQNAGEVATDFCEVARDFCTLSEKTPCGDGKKPVCGGKTQGTSCEYLTHSHKCCPEDQIVNAIPIFGCSCPSTNPCTCPSGCKFGCDADCNCAQRPH
mmetsp:Transcript_26433/g.81319  ORF Transcript_26433/g.81319 Transcript_26433/m.81319 type:complete len:183 (-) Transcript_26433:112-660(-)